MNKSENNYETPVAVLVEVHNEGVLCASTQQFNSEKTWGDWD